MANHNLIGSKPQAEGAMSNIIIVLDGEPVGKGRPRFRVVKTGSGQTFGSAYTPAKTRLYESSLRNEAVKAMIGRSPLDGPLAVVVWALMPVPASWSARKRDAALTGGIFPTGKPDWENVAKTLDAFNKVVWNDDSQVVDGRVLMLYTEWPALIVEVRPANLGAMPKFPGYGD